MDQNEKPVKHAIAGENIRAGALVALDVDECGAFVLVKYDPAKHDYQGEPGVLLHDVTAGRLRMARKVDIVTAGCVRAPRDHCVGHSTLASSRIASPNQRALVAAL